MEAQVRRWTVGLEWFNVSVYSVQLVDHYCLSLSFNENKKITHNNTFLIFTTNWTCTLKRRVSYTKHASLVTN